MTAETGAAALEAEGLNAESSLDPELGLERFEQVASTQAVVRGWLSEGQAEVCVAIADQQSGGRAVQRTHTGRVQRHVLRPAVHQPAHRGMVFRHPGGSPEWPGIDRQLSDGARPAISTLRDRNQKCSYICSQRALPAAPKLPGGDALPNSGGDERASARRPFGATRSDGSEPVGWGRWETGEPSDG